jgi:hypothetical protein
LEHRDKKPFNTPNFNIDLESQVFEVLSHPYFGPKVWNTKKKILSVIQTLVPMFGKLKAFWFWPSIAQH